MNSSIDLSPCQNQQCEINQGENHLCNQHEFYANTEKISNKQVDQVSDSQLPFGKKIICHDSQYCYKIFRPPIKLGS